MVYIIMSGAILLVCITPHQALLSPEIGEMGVKHELIRAFLNHDAINKAWLAEMLYGERNTSNTSLLRKKALGIEGRGFTEAELIRLDEIRRQFISELI